mgnify:CR=1 FL=1
MAIHRGRGRPRNARAGGRCRARPVGTVSAGGRHGGVRGGRMAMLTIAGALDAMGFPAGDVRPTAKKRATHMLGNAICPPVAQAVIEEVVANLAA